MSSVIALSRSAVYRVWRSRFARNVAIVAAGTAGAKAITMAFAPLITRIYGPEAFGLLGTFLAMVAVATPVAALAYPIAIVLPRNERDALGLVRLSTSLSFGMALFAVILLLLGGDWLTATLSAEAVAGYLFLIPVAMLFSAWMETAKQWLIRKKAFGVIARSAVAHSVILNSAKTGFGWLHPVGAVLIILATVGQALYAVLLFIGARRRYQPGVGEVEDGPRATLRELAFRHRDFPLYRAPQNLINATAQSLPVLLLAAFAGPMAAGFYTLTKLVMGIPSVLIGTAVSNVFYPRITEAAYNGENLPRHIVRATGALLGISLGPFGVVVLFGPWLFGFAFGEDWVMAGEYARWLALFFLFKFINRPSVATVPVLGIQRGLLVYEVFSAGTKVLALTAGFYLFDSDLWAVAFFSVTGVIAYSVMMVWILSHSMRWRADAKAS